MFLRPFWNVSNHLPIHMELFCSLFFLRTFQSYLSLLSANNRWRRLPPEYASTSEDEFGSNRNSPKHVRLRPGTTLRTSRLGGPAPVTTSPGGLLLKNRMREQEEYIRDWTAHSEEIARYSSTLCSCHTNIHVFVSKRTFLKCPIIEKSCYVVIFM